MKRYRLGQLIKADIIRGRDFIETHRFSVKMKRRYLSLFLDACKVKKCLFA